MNGMLSFIGRGKMGQMSIPFMTIRLNVTHNPFVQYI